MICILDLLLFCRIDGQLINLVNVSKLRLHNDTILVDLKRETNSSSGAVMMIAMQFQTGISVLDMRLYNDYCLENLCLEYRQGDLGLKVNYSIT